MRRRIRKGLAMLLTATMVVGLMPGAGTIKVSAAEGEASGSVATAEGYDENGFCTSYELTNGTWALKSGATACATHGETCKGYQPANKTTDKYNIDGVDGNDEVYEITNAGQLYWFADKINNDYENYKDKNAVLTKDITVNEGVLSNGELNTENESTFRSWTPIGYQDSSGTKCSYKGIFDGAGNTITGLYFDNPSKGAVGFFGLNSGTIKNVCIDDSFIHGSSNIGGVCAYNDTGGNIETCNNNGFINGENVFIGGVCGYNGGTITNCENTGNVFGSDCVGGVCGCNDGLVKNCSNRGNVKAYNSGAFGGVGGVCGNSTESLETSYNTGEVQGVKAVGGVCGYQYSGSIDSCYNTGNVTGTSTKVGGVCGYQSGSTSNCYSTGSVTCTAADTTGAYVGGVCGQQYGTIKNCYYDTGKFTGKAIHTSTTSSQSVYVEGKTSQLFSNGGVAYLLNSRSTEDSPVWYQNIDNSATPDTAPVLDSNHGTVYASKPCPVKCSNTESTASAESQAHSFGDDNICTVCGAKGEIIDDPTLINDKPSNVDGVYQIKTVRELYYFVALVNGRLVGVDQDTSASAVLTQDIVVNDNLLEKLNEDGTVKDDNTVDSWVTIGYDDGLKTCEYTGTFDGKGHIISGLYLDSENYYIGLFGISSGTIKNVAVKNCYFKGKNNVGAVCGYNKGLIENCTVENGSVCAFENLGTVGGICGSNDSSITNCSTQVTVVCSEKNITSGGICGSNNAAGTVSKCHSSGNIQNTKSAVRYGGVCGINYGNISDCYNETAIKNVGTGTTFGGICGQNHGEIITSYNTGEISFKDDSGSSDNVQYGGICGRNYKTISDCYNSGSITYISSYGGGICGYNYKNDAQIKNCYDGWNIDTDAYRIAAKNNGTIINCYYLYTKSDTSAKTSAQFASGEVAYLLNEGKTDNDVVWRQTLNTDTAPVLDSTHSIVYASKPCESEFANTEFTEEKQHNYQISTDGAYHQCSYCKKTEQHADVATFTVDDETHSITADCPSCGNLGTITLSASGETYDGTEKSHVSGEIKGFTPTIEYEKKAEGGSFEKIESTPKDAGTYRASITYTVGETNNKVYSVSTEYTIARRPVTITANNENKTYGNLDPTLSYNVSDTTPLVDSEELSGKLSRLTGENAGTYTITQGTVTNDNNPNYDITFNEGTFTIIKARTDGTANCEMELQYDETSGRYTATIEKVDKAEYRFDNGEWSSNNTLTGIAHGTQVTGYIRIAGDDNHDPGAESSKELTSGHGTLTHYEAKEADCVNDGNVEYWYCESCGKYFSDADGKTETTKDAVTIKATGHTGYDEDGVCDTCSAIVDAYKHLQTLITSVKDIEQGDYSDASWQAFETALAEANKLTNESTAEELTAAYEALDNAKKGLKQGTFIVGTVASPSNTGVQTGGGRYAVGETVTLTAQGVEGWTFNGWYDSDKLISDKAEVTFTVTEDMSGTVSYSAKYTHVSHTMDETSHTCSVCGTKYYKVTFDYGNSTTKEVYTTGNVEFPAGDYIFKVGDDVIDTADYTVSEDTTITVESLDKDTKHAVTITGDAHCTLTVTDSNGNTVVSGDEVAAGTILKVSVKVDDGYTLTTPPASSYTVNEATTITAVTQAKTYAVTVDNTYYQNSEAEAPTASVDDLSAVPYGTALTLTAADANTGYEFLGWYQTNGKQLTAEKEYTVTITSALTVQPRYQMSSGTVTFVANGSVVGTFTDTSITEENLPETPVAPSGYEFDSWDKTITEINTMLADNNNVTVTATFKKIANSFTVSVYNGNATEPLDTAYEETAKITVTAQDVADMKFAYWTLNGEIQSYNKTIAFYASSNCVLKAVYSDVVTTAKGTATLQTGNYDLSTKRLSMVCYLTVPDGYTMVKAGVVAASGTSNKYNAQDELTMDNADYVKTGSNLSGLRSLTYTWIKTNVCVGDTWYARAYVTYTDSQNNTVTVYGDRIILNAGTDYDYTEKASAKINSVSWDASTKRATFVSYITVPDGAVMEKAGIVAANSSAYNPETAILTTENASYVKSGTNLSSLQTLTYTWIKSNVSSGDIWYARAYVIYTDESGNSHTVYGNIIKYQAE